MLATYLFVPAHDERKVAKALASAADALILDLEDAVPEGSKEAARQAAARIVRGASSHGPQLWVRVNAAQTPHHEDDVRAIDWGRADGLVLPKAEDPGSIGRLAALDLRGVLLILESAAGLARVDALVAAAPGVPRLALGQYDLALDLGLMLDDPDESELMWHVRCQMVLASRSLGLGPPVDAVYGRIGDPAGFEARSLRARQMGFGAKLLIHPEQIAPAARIYGVESARLIEAQAIVDAYEAAARDGRGAISFRGELIDRVHVERARALLARWGGSAAPRPDPTRGRP